MGKRSIERGRKRDDPEGSASEFKAEIRRDNEAVDELNEMFDPTSGKYPVSAEPSKSLKFCRAVGTR